MTSTRCDSAISYRKTRRAISLLEVVLALAILAMSAAYLAQSMELATTNAIKSQRLTQAELVAESVMNQVIAGVIPPDPVTWTPYFNSMGQTDWMYQIQSVPTEVQDMIGLQVAVQQVTTNDFGATANSYDLFANRWIINPELGLDTPPEDDYGDEGYGGGSYGGGSYGGESGGGAAGAGGGGAAPAGGGGFGGFGAGGPGGGRGGQGGPGGGRGGGGPGGARGGGGGQGGARGGGGPGGAGGRGGAGGGGARGGGGPGGAGGRGGGGAPGGGGARGGGGGGRGGAGGGGFGGFGAGFGGR